MPKDFRNISERSPCVFSIWICEELPWNCIASLSFLHNFEIHPGNVMCVYRKRGDDSFQKKCALNRKKKKWRWSFSLPNGTGNHAQGLFEFCGTLLWVLQSVGPVPPFSKENKLVFWKCFLQKCPRFKLEFSLGSKSEKTDTAEEKKKTTTKNKNQPLDSRLEICKIHRLQSMCHSVPTACSSFTTGYFDKPISAPRSKLVPLKRQNQSKKMLFPDHSPKEVAMAFKRIIRFKSQFSKSNQANPSNFALGGGIKPSIQTSS